MPPSVAGPIVHMMDSATTRVLQVAVLSYTLALSPLVFSEGKQVLGSDASPSCGVGWTSSSCGVGWASSSCGASFLPFLRPKSASSAVSENSSPTATKGTVAIIIMPNALP